jgi:hypothetical protein
VPANGTATCDGTACGFTCNANYQLCNGACTNIFSRDACGPNCEVCTSQATRCNGTRCCDIGAPDCQ